MQLLEERIVRDGQGSCGGVLKVDGFSQPIRWMWRSSVNSDGILQTLCDCGVTKILTIEASGIGIACITAQFFHGGGLGQKVAGRRTSPRRSMPAKSPPLPTAA
jgi:xanthine phosphoribosyltransferase